MVYPVSSQQIPAANTFQPGGGVEQVKRDDSKVQDKAKPAGSETVRTSSSDTRNSSRTEETRQYASSQSSDRSSDNGSVSSSSARGGQLDIVV